MQSRPGAPRTQSYTGRMVPPRLEPARPVTAPGSSFIAPVSPQARQSRSTFELPPLASITERAGGNHPSHPVSSRFELPPLQERHRTSNATDTTRASWSTQISQAPTDYSFARQGSSSSTWNTSSFSTEYSHKDARSSVGWAARPPNDGVGNFDRPRTSGESPMMGRSVHSPQAGSTSSSLRYEQAYHPASESMAYAHSREADQRQPTLSSSSANYSRVLVGSLCAHCWRLQDENGQTGLFFFTQDLGVRTEGTFVLKLSLINRSTGS